jgi:hypothetical protein
MLTKKDFEAIALLLRAERTRMERLSAVDPVFASYAERELLGRIAGGLEQLFEESNPKFNRHRWRVAVYGIEL